MQSDIRIHMNIKNIIKVSFFTLLSRFLGLFRDIILSRYLGASLISDAFFVAFKIPNLFRRFFAEGSMQSAFIPLFSKLITKDINKARRFSAEVFTLFFLLLICFIITLEVFAPYVIQFISPGLAEKGSDIFNLAVALLRITLPYLLFVSLSSFYSSILNSLGKFALVAFLPALLNISMIILLLFATNYPSIFINNAYAASYGVLFGGVLQLAMVVFACYKKKWFISFTIVKKIGIHSKSFFKRLVPVVLGAGVYQVNIIIDLFVASFLPIGAISYLFYADRIYQLPLAIIGIAIGTVILPSIASASSDIKHIIKQKAILLALSITLPATLGLFIFSEEIIMVIFFGGQFNLAAVKTTSIILAIYSLSLPANILIKIILPFFYAQGDTKTPLYTTLACLATNLILVFYLANLFGVYGIAFATVVASYLNFLLLSLFLIKKDGLHFNSNFITEIKNILYISILLIIYLIFIKNILAYFPMELFWFRMTFLVFVISAIILVVFVAKILNAELYLELSKIFNTNKNKES